MYSRVLIPLDGTEKAEAAIEEALELASAVKSIHLVLVENPVFQARRLEGYTIFVDEYVKIRKEMGEDYLLQFQKKLESAGIEVKASVLFGDQVPMIEKVAREKEVDLILVGGREGSWLRRSTGLAGIAQRLSRRTNVAVMLVSGEKTVHEEREEKLAPAA
jgi:nucleotide-binding universal stress UspA family protein